MAKEPTKAAAAAPEAATPSVVAVGAFKFDIGVPVPALARKGAVKTGELNEKLAAMPLGASFLEPVEPVADTITDPAERAKVVKEKSRAVTNRLSSAVRRFKKANAGVEFALRTVDGGVRVFRVEVADAPAAAAV